MVRIKKRFSDTSEQEEEIVSVVEDEGQPSTKKVSRGNSNSALTQRYESIEFKVVQERNDFFLHQILDFVETKRWINLTPEYQRRKRWDQKKKSLLIESLLMNLPVPPIFLYEVEPASFEVMDGQQRLNTIIEFYRCQLVLKGLEAWPELNGRTYNDCPRRIQRGIDRRKISSVILTADTHDGDGLDSTELRRQVFERLNTGGEKLNPQELRNCLYAGALNNLILELSRSRRFTSIWGIPSYGRYEEDQTDVSDPRKSNRLYRTMADNQIVLRYFAFRGRNELKGSVRSMLDGFMKKNQNPDKDQLSEMKARFTGCLKLAEEIFAQSTFRLPKSKGGKLSVPLYDAVMVALDSYLEDRAKIITRKKAIVSQLEKMLGSERSYAVLVGRPNTAAAIIKRIEQVKKIIRSSLRH